jgi:hypothetical protein
MIDMPLWTARRKNNLGKSLLMLLCDYLYHPLLKKWSDALCPWQIELDETRGAEGRIRYYLKLLRLKEVHQRFLCKVRMILNLKYSRFDLRFIE